MSTKNRANKRRRKRRRTDKEVCESKVRYASETVAVDAAVRTGRYYYRCDVCGGFHVRSRP